MAQWGASKYLAKGNCEKTLGKKKKKIHLDQLDFLHAFLISRQSVSSWRGKKEEIVY